MDVLAKSIVYIIAEMVIYILLKTAVFFEVLRNTHKLVQLCVLVERN